MAFNEVMIDLETSGTEPNHTAIIQIAAVRFDLENMSIDHNMFNQCLLIPGNRYWDEGTREWWSNQDPKILEGIWPRMRDPQTVLREFAAWVRRDLDGASPILWAKPTHFEYPFLESYFRQFEVSSPFHYSEAQDLRSWCRARGMKDLDREIDFEGTAHDAIDDVLHQITTLFTLLEKTNVVHNAG